MTLGPGKYDDLVTSIRESTEVRAVALIVIGGSRGHGMSLQGQASQLRLMPRLLRLLADEIDGEQVDPADTKES